MNWYFTITQLLFHLIPSNKYAGMVECNVSRMMPKNSRM